MTCKLTLKLLAALALGLFCVLAPFTGISKLFSAPGGLAKDSKAAGHDWPVYGANAEGNRYSPLTQINRDNVKNLKMVWNYDTGEKGGLETSPIVIDDVLYAYTPSQKVIALDAATGKLLWKFDSGVASSQPARGLSTWTDGKHRRILAGVMNYLYALDASTGKPIPAFGDAGRIDLREGLGRDPKAVDVSLTSPGMVYKDLIIVGGRMPESLPCAPGDIRAYDVRNGKMRWAFHTIPHPGEFGYDTWPPEAWKHSGSANNWAGMALDARRGIVYIPTGSAASDFYGADRVGDDLFANCLLALDASTGKRLWHFQGVKHDLWDRDYPSPPVLLTVEHDGKQIDAVAQTSKQGFVYLFDRASGTPLFPIEYKDYPASDVPGEVTAKTQGLPTKPAPFARQLLTEDLLSDRTPEVHGWALERFHSFRSGGQFVPFAVDRGTVVFPGFDGGGEWGGPAVDPDTKIIYINSNDLAYTGGLAKRPEGGSRGQQTYVTHCAMCHHADLSGSPPEFPSLKNEGSRHSEKEIDSIVRMGRGRMPSFGGLSDAQLTALVHFVLGTETKRDIGGGEVDPEANYYFTGYDKFLDPDGYPAVKPPWGTLNAINLNTGEYVWKIPFGEYPELAAQGVKNTGSDNYGGPAITAGGLLFIGATVHDKKFHAYDKSTGELLWETTLPFSSNGTPAIYEIKGRQYVAISAGGGRWSRMPSGGIYAAFALSQ